jgi:hypothetical protein
MERPPAIAAELVNEFVRKAHSDLDRVKELLAQEPKLVNACWDWGGGDFESAIGAAAHTGRREIAEFLLANGARMDIFTAAMLGHLDLVKAAITADPRVKSAPGAHGIPLLAHAKMGGEPALPVLQYLQSLG